VIPILDGAVQLDSTKRLPLGAWHHQDLLAKSLSLKYAQHKNTLSQPDTIQYIMENHTHCAGSYRDQIRFLETIYNEETAYQREEDRKKREALYGENYQNYRDEEKHKVCGPVKVGNVTIFDSNPCAGKVLLYKNRIERDNLKLFGECAGVDREDHVMQLPWIAEVAPSEEEVKKRIEMRKEQGHRLREMMERKRAEKKRKLEEELVDLQSLESLREQGDNASFKEEL
jgi:hypothetical protein